MVGKYTQVDEISPARLFLDVTKHWLLGNPTTHRPTRLSIDERSETPTYVRSMFVRALDWSRDASESVRRGFSCTAAMQCITSAISSAQEEKKKNFILPKASNYNTNTISKHRGGFPEGQTPIVLDTLSDAEYNIENKKNTVHYRSTLMNIRFGTNVIKKILQPSSSMANTRIIIRRFRRDTYL